MITMPETRTGVLARTRLLAPVFWLFRLIPARPMIWPMFLMTICRALGLMTSMWLATFPLPLETIRMALFPWIPMFVTIKFLALVRRLLRSVRYVTCD